MIKILIEISKVFYRIAFVCMIFTLITECKPYNDSNPAVAEKENSVKCKVEQAVLLIDCQYRFFTIGTEIKVPLYGGKDGEISISELKKKLNKDNWPSFGFSYPAGGGKKKLLDILEFYKGNLLKDIDIYRPSVIGGEAESWIIWYDYDTPGGMPGTVMIMASMPSGEDKMNYDESLLDEDTGLRDIRAIYLDESAPQDGNDNFILFVFGYGQRSGFSEEKEKR